MEGQTFVEEGLEFVVECRDVMQGVDVVEGLDVMEGSDGVDGFCSLEVGATGFKILTGYHRHFHACVILKTGGVRVYNDVQIQLHSLNHVCVSCGGLRWLPEVLRGQEVPKMGAAVAPCIHTATLCW
jgi:hypothetical protein